MAEFDPELSVEVTGNGHSYHAVGDQLFGDLLQAKGPAMVGRQGHRA